MSIFSKIKRSKKAATQHQEKKKEKDAEPAKVPYKHIPTHAAFDALSGAPSSWNQEDRTKIREQHKRRSQMVITRTASSLSTTTTKTSYLNAAAGPNSQAPPLPRNSSYSSYNPTWYNRGENLTYPSEPVPKRQKPSRGLSYHDFGIGPSPLASNIQSEGTSSAVEQSHPFFRSISAARINNELTSDTVVSLAVSSSNSTHSNSSDQDHDHFEMAQKTGHRSDRPQPIVYAEKDIFDKLHTSTTRKLGEAPLYDSPPVLFKTAVATTMHVSQDKPKRSRWSLVGRKNDANTSAT